MCVRHQSVGCVRLSVRVFDLEPRLLGGRERFRRTPLARFEELGAQLDAREVAVVVTHAARAAEVAGIDEALALGLMLEPRVSLGARGLLDELPRLGLGAAVGAGRQAQRRQDHAASRAPDRPTPEPDRLVPAKAADDARWSPLTPG